MDYWVSVTRPGPIELSVLAELAPAVTSTDGVQQGAALRYLSGGDGPTIVLLHGRGHASTAWYPLLPRLVANFRVVAIDLPGFGHSGAPPLRTDDPEEALAYFVDPVEARLQEMGIADPILVGHSLGGFVALELALRKRVAPRQLVMIGGMGLGPEMTSAARAFFQVGPERLARHLGPIVSRLSRGPGKHSPVVKRLTQLEHELYTAHGARRAPAAAFRVLATPISPVFHRADRLRQVDIPTLLIWGDRDEVFPVRVGVRAAELLPQSELLVLPAGHAPHWEHVETVLDTMESFFARHQKTEAFASQVS